jgi:integrase
MRKSRYQKGSIKKQRGRWVAMWWVGQSRKSRVIGLVKDMTKSDARAVVDRIVSAANAKRDENRVWCFGELVREIYLPFYSRKWKASTKGSSMNRVLVHLVAPFETREVSGLRRDELQDLLDEKARVGLSFSTVDHLRWDLKAVFDMALAEGHITRNPALLLFTPREATRAEKCVMTITEVQTCFAVLGLREKLIAKLALLVGMRPGEIFALTWGRLKETHAEITQRVYRGVIDTPKTSTSVRYAALPDGLLRDVELWRSIAAVTDDAALVFPSERMTPLAKENIWRRSMYPKLEPVGLAWANFQVMRRTHSTLMRSLGIDGKLVADQLGHSLDVNQNVYTQTSVETRLPALNRLEETVLVM